MIQPMHIMALSQPGFIQQQLRSVFCAGRCNARRESFWKGWGLPEPGGPEA